MKSTYLTLALCVLTCTAAAQSIDPVEKRAEGIAVLFCHCINEMMDDLHPAFREYIMDIGKIGEAAAGNKLTARMESLPPEELTRIVEGSDRLKNFEASMASIPGCKEVMELSSAYEKEYDSYNDALTRYIQSRSDCALTKVFLQAGE